MYTPYQMLSFLSQNILNLILCLDCNITSSFKSKHISIKFNIYWLKNDNILYLFISNLTQSLIPIYAQKPGFLLNLHKGLFFFVELFHYFCVISLSVLFLKFSVLTNKYSNNKCYNVKINECEFLNSFLPIILFVTF